MTSRDGGMLRTAERASWRINQGIRFTRAARRGRAGQWLFWHEVFRLLARKTPRGGRR
jgi:hypothetical protein